MPLYYYFFLSGFNMRLKNKILLSFGIFILSYLASLILWIHVKSYYGLVLSKLGSYFASATMNCRIESFSKGKEVTKINFSKLISTTKGIGKLSIDVSISVSNYSFNIPLTIALIASLFPFFKWKKRYILEAFTILILVHILYIYSYCCVHIYHILAKVGVQKLTSTGQIFWESLWTFTDNFVIRFEPFLLTLYIWFRNKQNILS